MFFVKWIAPVILMICGSLMLRMGIRWFRAGRPTKGILDIIVAISFLIVAAMLPGMSQP